jgi:hypothetical protein
VRKGEKQTMSKKKKRERKNQVLPGPHENMGKTRPDKGEKTTKEGANNKPKKKRRERERKKEKEERNKMHPSCTILTSSPLFCFLLCVLLSTYLRSPFYFPPSLYPRFATRPTQNVPPWRLNHSMRRDTSLSNPHRATHT